MTAFVLRRLAFACVTLFAVLTLVFVLVRIVPGDPAQLILGDQQLVAGTQFGVLMPFSRKDESEADAIGLLYMARAGYDPRESIRFWQRMENVGGSQPPEFLSSHPSHGTRIQQLQAEMPKALEEYNRSSHAETDSSR